MTAADALEADEQNPGVGRDLDQVLGKGGQAPGERPPPRRCLALLALLRVPTQGTPWVRCVGPAGRGTRAEQTAAGRGPLPGRGGDQGAAGRRTGRVAPVGGRGVPSTAAVEAVAGGGGPVGSGCARSGRGPQLPAAVPRLVRIRGEQTVAVVSTAAGWWAVITPNTPHPAAACTVAPSDQREIHPRLFARQPRDDIEAARDSIDRAGRTDADAHAVAAIARQGEAAGRADGAERRPEASEP